MADPMYRHDAGGNVTEMSADACQARIGGFFDNFTQLDFRTVHIHTGDQRRVLGDRLVALPLGDLWT